MAQSITPATRELSALSQMANEGEDIDALLERAAQALVEVLPGDLVGIFDIDDDPEHAGRAARCRVLSTSSNVSLDPGESSLDLRNAAILEQVAESCRARVVEGSIQLRQELAPLVEELEGDRLRSALLVPIHMQGTCRGFVTVLSSEKDGFQKGHRDLARLYANVLAIALEAGAEASHLRRDNEVLARRSEVLRDELATKGASSSSPVTTWKSPEMVQVARLVEQVAATDAPIFITGETGTGKEVTARWLHSLSERREQAFVTVNCAALPSELIESELFGHAKGAFSGAHKARAGRFEVADGGTLLLDELGEMPLELQPKLLRVLQDGEFHRVGEDRPRRVDVRVVAATNRDVPAEVAAGRFREDLYYRLNVLPIALPPLRDRLEDLPALCEVLLAEIQERTGCGPFQVTDAAIEMLRRRPWPGNIRELRNVLERSAILSTGEALTIHAGPSAPLTATEDPVHPAPGGDWPTLDEHVRRYLERVLRRTGGQIYGDEGAAQILDMRPTTLQSRLKRMGIDREDFE